MIKDHGLKISCDTHDEQERKIQEKPAHSGRQKLHGQDHGCPTRIAHGEYCRHAQGSRRGVLKARQHRKHIACQRHCQQPEHCKDHALHRKLTAAKHCIIKQIHPKNDLCRKQQDPDERCTLYIIPECAQKGYTDIPLLILFHFQQYFVQSCRRRSGCHDRNTADKPQNPGPDHLHQLVYCRRERTADTKQIPHNTPLPLRRALPFDACVNKRRRESPPPLNDISHLTYHVFLLCILRVQKCLQLRDELLTNRLQPYICRIGVPCRQLLLCLVRPVQGNIELQLIRQR